MPILSAIMVFVFLLGILAPVVSGLLLVVGEPFPGRIPFCLAYNLIIAERVYAMFFRIRTKDVFGVKKDWTSAAVGLAYAGVMYGILFEFFRRGSAAPFPAASLGGFVLYAGAVLLRYSAFHHLGRQWVVHLDRNDAPERSLVRSGPYAWIRHPLYVGACLEVIGAPLAFNAFGTLVFALLVFVPLEIHRARFEERFLLETFGEEYRAYAEEVRGFFPLPSRKKISESP